MYAAALFALAVQDQKAPLQQQPSLPPAIAQPQSGPPLPLDRALQIAVENAFSIRSQETRVERARQLRRQAEGVFGPSVTVNGSYTRFDGTISGTGTGTSTGSGRSAESRQTGSPTNVNDSKTASVSLTQIVDIAGVNHRAAEAAGFNVRAAEAGVGAAENDLKLNVRKAYYQVLLAKALVGVQQDAVTAAQSRLSQGQLRFEQGAIARFDVLRLQNEVRKAQQALVQAQGNYVTSKQNLNSALSRPIETPFEEVDVPGLPQFPDDPRPLVVEAVRNRPEIQQSEYTITALGFTAEAQRASLSPQLVLQATHDRIIDPLPGQGSQGTFGVLQLYLPVFDSGVTQAKVEAARQDQQQAKIGLEQLLLGIALEVRSELTQAKTAQETYQVAEDSVNLATEALRLAQIRYESGAGILLDVIQAQADLTSAQGNLQNARNQVLNAYANLLRAIGRDDLSPQEQK